MLSLGTSMKFETKSNTQASGIEMLLEIGWGKLNLTSCCDVKSRAIWEAL